MSERKKYPIGLQSFSEIINGEYLYVDKTEFIYRMIDTGKYYFLSRPRRFGKSLLLSTIEAYFLGQRELFRGLAIDRHEDLKWESHPVLHLDLNAQDYTKDEQSLYNQIDTYLRIWEDRYGVVPEVKDLGIRFSLVIEAAYRETGRQVVVLIDEYDKPMLQNLGEGRQDRQNRFRETLKGFYGALKSCDRYIRFALLTGVTKFGKISVFSDLNNLRDITLEPDYNAICGITESELLTDMREGIELLAERQRMGFAATCARLKSNYDGYRFSEEDAEGIYNPFSLLNVMESRRFADYWFMTATPTMLIELLRHRDIELSSLEGAIRTESELMGLDPVFRDPIPLLFQCGYLTIKGTDYDIETTYRLGFPNEEVERGFLKALIPYYIDTVRGDTGFRVTSFIEALREGNVNKFMELLKSLLAEVPYRAKKGEKIYEERFRDVLFILCRLMGLRVQSELHTSVGRIDMTIETAHYIYLMEFKVDQSPEKALDQIEDRGYANRYLSDQRTLVKVGVSFSTSERNISAWIADPDLSNS